MLLEIRIYISCKKTRDSAQSHGMLWSKNRLADTLALADSYLKKVHDAQERAENFQQKLVHNDFRNFSTLTKSFQHQCQLHAQKRNKIEKYHGKVKSKRLNY